MLCGGQATQGRQRRHLRHEARLQLLPPLREPEHTGASVSGTSAPLNQPSFSASLTSEAFEGSQSSVRARSHIVRGGVPGVQSPQRRVGGLYEPNPVKRLG